MPRKRDQREMNSRDQAQDNFEIPGFYYDPEKKRYFKISNEPGLPAKQKKPTSNTDGSRQDSPKHVVSCTKTSLLEYMQALDLTGHRMTHNFFNSTHKQDHTKLVNFKDDYHLMKSTIKYQVELSNYDEKISNLSLVKRLEDSNPDSVLLLFSYMKRSDRLMASNESFTTRLMRLSLDERSDEESSRNQSSRVEQIELMNCNSKHILPGRGNRNEDYSLRNNEFFIEKLSTTQPKVVHGRFLMTTSSNLRGLEVGYICDKLENDDSICHRFLENRSSIGHQGNHMYHLTLFNINFNSAVWSSNLCSSILSRPNRPIACAAGLESRAEICNIHGDSSVHRTRLNTNNSIAYSVEFGVESDYVYTGCKNRFLFGYDLRADPFRQTCKLQHESCVHNIRHHEQSRNYLFSQDFTSAVYLWDIRMQRIVNKYADRSIEFDSRSKMNLTEDMSYLYTVSKDATVRVWNLKTHEMSMRINPYEPNHPDEAYKELPNFEILDNRDMIYQLENKLEYRSIS